MPEPIVAYYWETLPGLITIGLAVLAALPFWWLWWQLPKREAARLALTNPKDSADVEDNFRKAVGQVLGGVAVILGAGFAYLQFSQQQLQFSQQQQASHDLLISNQVSKGFEQLGNKDTVVVRLGGIYALEGVMNTSDQYHQPVLEALSAFIREGAKLPSAPPTPGSATQGPPTDIQAALTVIGRRSAGAGVVNLTNANIASADLRGADLSGTQLTNADLSGAHLNNADLRSAHLANASLTEANLSRADLSRANLSRANLGEAEIGQSQLDEACGLDAVLPPGLTLKPCPPKSSP